MFRFTYALALVAALSLSSLVASPALAGNNFGGHSGQFSGHNGQFSGNKNKSFQFNGGNFHHFSGGNFNHNFQHQHHNHHHNNGFFFQSKNFGFQFSR